MSPYAVVRRGWVVLLIALMVTGIALAVRKLYPPRYTAKSVLVVPTQATVSGPGDANEAARLATTYMGLIPSSAPLVQAVAGRLGISPLEVGDAIRVTGVAGTSLLFLHFHADSPALAERGALAVAQAASSGIPGIASGSVTPLEASKAAKSVQRATGRPGYSATATALVSSGAGSQGPTGATEADTLATTLASVIPNDQVTLAAVGHRLGSSAEDIRAHLRVVQEGQTSLLDVLFQDQTPAQALLGARTVAQAVTNTPATGAIAPQSLEMVRLPTTTSESAASSAAVPLGAALGVLLGFLLLFAWERANPEIRNARGAEKIGRTSATDVTRLSPATASALVERWQHLDRPAGRGSRSGTRSVALVAVKPDVIQASGEVAAQLAGSLTLYEDLDRELARVVSHDVIVLVVTPRTRARDFQRVIDLLAGLGRRPDWTLVAAPRRVRRVSRASRRAVPEGVR